MPSAFPVSQIESHPQSTSSRRGDGTFEHELEKAKADLIRLFMPIFDFKIVKIDFNADFSPEQKPEEDKKLQPVYEQSNKYYKKDKLTKEGNNPYLTIADTKTIKEALIKFVPHPVVPACIPGALLTQNQSSGVISKVDLQILIDQIVEQAKLLKAHKKTELSLMLAEKELGELSLVLTSRNGFVSIQIGASPETKKNLENHIKELENALKSASIDLDQIKIVEINNGFSA